MDYIKTRSDKIYDRVMDEKILINPSDDAYTELKEGLWPWQFAQLVRKDGHHRHLDEWANDFDCTVSELIKHLQHATPEKDRGAATRELEQKRIKHYLRGETMSNKVELNLEVRPKTILEKIDTVDLLKELDRRRINGGLSDGRTQRSETEFGDPRGEIEES